MSNSLDYMGVFVKHERLSGTQVILTYFDLNPDFEGFSLKNWLTCLNIDFIAKIQKIAILVLNNFFSCLFYNNNQDHLCITAIQLSDDATKL